MSVNLFNANFYRAANSDLASLNDAQALAHFQNYGLNEGRAFSPFVSLNFYRSSNSDLTGFSNQQVLAHLQNNGVAEARRFSPFVSLGFYREVSGDLAGLNNEQMFEHLRNNGLNEARRFSPFVDLNLYRLASPDLTSAPLDNRQLLEHLVRDGVAQGRRFSVGFDINYYRNANPDLATLGLNNRQLLEHFEIYGLNEGRASSESLNVSYYLANSPDLTAARFNYQQAYQHFELSGFREGRLGNPSIEFAPTDPAIGNTLNTAFSLGVLNGSRIVRDFVGTTDRDDYYRLTLASTSNLNLLLSGLTGGAGVELILDKNGNGQFDLGESLYSDNGSTNDNASIRSPLGAGTYFIRVNTGVYSSTNTNYALGVSATPILPTTPRDPGNALNTALNIGTLSGSRSFSDFVGSVDLDDYYRFTLASATSLNVSLSGLNNSTTVNLIFDGNGNDRVDYNETSAYDSGTINDNAYIGSPLGAGTYFIGVNVSAYSSTNTTYTLTLSA